ncbi:MAG: DsbE family thiol:disulfide interchange protein [Legionella sp.]|nr:DsbE family thiol:disulfide interchange protein [Legionella sp.]
MKKNMIWGLLPFCVFAVLIAFFWRGLSLNPAELPLAQLNQPLPAFEVPILGDKTRMLSSESMQGHPAILHVFASWCDVCATEQVFLLKLADNGVPLYGLNYKDDAFDAMRWLQTWGNPYRLIGIDKEGRTGIDLGVYGTPETFLIDSNGVIRYRHVGALTANIWDEVLLKQWQALL